jgi:hypothetical protein
MHTKPHQFIAALRTAIATRKPRKNTGQTCTICRHERRYEIELALTAGVSSRAVAKKFTVSRDAAWRHLTNHVTPERRAQLVAGPMKLGQLAEKATAEGTTLIDYLGMIRSVLMARFLAAAETGDNQSTGLLAGRLNEALRLMASVTGELQNATAGVTNNILIANSPFVADLQSMLLRVLSPFPEARLAVIRGLEDLSSRAIPSAPAGQLIEHHVN